MYSIGIVGYGTVGQGIHRLFRERVEAIYDPGMVDDIPYDLVAEYGSGRYAICIAEIDKRLFKKLDLVVVCVPTPTRSDGSCDASIVKETVAWLVDVNPNLLILVKSTVVPSEIERIQKKYNARLVSSPEYMGESKYFTPFWKYPDPKEMKMHDFQIFGGEPEDTSECVDIFIRVMGPHVQYYQTDLKTAALCKYMENSFFATKVTFCNEWYEIAKAHGVDYNELRELWLADSRVSPMHTAVFPKDRGYGGKCYPKDVKAAIVDSDGMGYLPLLLDTVDKVNNEFRKENSN